MKSKSDFFMLGLKKSFIIVSNFEIFWSIPWHDIPAKQIFSIKLTSRLGTPRLGRHGLILIHQFCETGLWTFCALPYGPYDMEKANSHLPIIKNKNLKNCIWQFEIKCDFSSVRKSSIADTAVVKPWFPAVTAKSRSQIISDVSGVSDRDVNLILIHVWLLLSRLGVLYST